MSVARRCGVREDRFESQVAVTPDGDLRVSTSDGCGVIRVVAQGGEAASGAERWQTGRKEGSS